MRDRAKEIKEKGFSIVRGKEETLYQQGEARYQGIPTDFNKIKVGTRILEDATYNLGCLKKANPRLADKKTVLKAINDCDLPLLREISDFFYKNSGINTTIFIKEIRNLS